MSDASGYSDHSSGNGGGASADGSTDGGGRGGTGATAGASGTGGTGAASGTGGTGANSGTGGVGGASATDGPSETGGRDGGGVPTTCANNPLSATATWIATASHSSLGNSMESDPLYNPPSHISDGNINERWSAGKPQAADEWLQIDFGRSVAIGQVTLQRGGNPLDYPRGYATRVSDTPLDFSAPVLVSGAGQQSVDTVILLPSPAVGRYLLISQTGTATSWWTVAEMTVACTD